MDEIIEGGIKAEENCRYPGRPGTLASDLAHATRSQPTSAASHDRHARRPFATSMTERWACNESSGILNRRLRLDRGSTTTLTVEHTDWKSRVHEILGFFLISFGQAARRAWTQGLSLYSRFVNRTPVTTGTMSPAAIAACRNSIAQSGQELASSSSDLQSRRHSENGPIPWPKIEDAPFRPAPRCIDRRDIRRLTAGRF